MGYMKNESISRCSSGLFQVSGVQSWRKKRGDWVESEGSSLPFFPPPTISGIAPLIKTPEDCGHEIASLVFPCFFPHINFSSALYVIKSSQESWSSKSHNGLVMKISLYVVAILDIRKGVYPHNEEFLQCLGINRNTPRNDVWGGFRAL